MFTSGDGLSPARSRPSFTHQRDGAVGNRTHEAVGCISVGPDQRRPRKPLHNQPASRTSASRPETPASQAKWSFRVRFMSSPCRLTRLIVRAPRSSRDVLSLRRPIHESAGPVRVRPLCAAGSVPRASPGAHRRHQSAGRFVPSSVELGAVAGMNILLAISLDHVRWQRPKCLRPGGSVA